MSISKPVTMKFGNESDIAEVRNIAYEIASGMGFNKTGCAETALAVSEIVSNAVKFAGKGIAVIRLSGNKKCLEAIVQDNGPGIKSLKKAMDEGFSSVAASLGIGLNAAKRAMDEFSVKSRNGQGTEVFMKKYLPIPEEEIEYGIISLNDERYPVNGDICH